MDRVLITGGNKGIGLEVTKELLEMDYEVIVVARDFTGFEYKGHKNVKTVEFDMQNVDKIPALIESIGEIDILINNAGVPRREAFLKNVTSGRFAKAKEIADTIVWLATESPNYINGSCIDINDGSFPR